MVLCQQNTIHRTVRVMFVHCIDMHFEQTSFNKLDVRSLTVASRSRQSEKQPIVDELALIEHAHIWEGVSVREEQWRRVTDKVITIEQAYDVTTIQASIRATRVDHKL